MSSRAFAAAVLLASGGACVAAVAVSCAETRRGLGEECLKSDDCLSGICAGQRCVAAPPLLDGEAPPGMDSGPPASDAAVDGTISDAPPPDAPTPPADSPSDARDSAAPPDAASSG